MKAIEKVQGHLKSDLKVSRMAHFDKRIIKLLSVTELPPGRGFNSKLHSVKSATQKKGVIPRRGRCSIHHVAG